VRDQAAPIARGADENTVIRLLLAAVAQRRELDPGLERRGFESTFLTEEVVLAERADRRHGVSLSMRETAASIAHCPAPPAGVDQHPLLSRGLGNFAA
jgi:hypothetical protein